MKLRQTALLFVVFCLLLGTYFWFQHYRESKSFQLQQAKKLFSFTPEEITRISIERIGESPSVAERISETQWRITAPNPTIVPHHRMWNRVATHMAALINEHTVLETMSDPAQYGLDAPALRVETTLNNGTRYVLCFGDVEPTQRRRYAQLDSGPLILVSTDSFFELNRSLYDLRHRYLVNDRESPLLRIEFSWIWTDPPKEDADRVVQTGQESIVVVVQRETPESPWRVVSPYDAPGRHEKIEELAKELQFAVCKEFIDSPESLTDYGLQPARARIVFMDASSNERQSVWVGSVDTSPNKQGLFVRTEGRDAVQVIDSHLMNLLPTSPLEWRDLRLFTNRLSDLKQLTYRAPNDKFILSKGSDGGWKLDEPSLESINEHAINGFLTYIKEAEGDDFVESSEAASWLEHPEVRIHLQFENGKESEILIGPRPDTPEVYVARQDTGGYITLKGVAAKMLRISSDAFCSLELLRFVKANVQELDIFIDDKTYQIVKRHDLWVAKQPENFQISNQADVDALLSAICALQARSLAYANPNPADSAACGLDQPVFTINLKLDPPHPSNQPLTLKIGNVTAENSGERFAESNMRKGIFRISQEVMDDIREALRAFL